MYCPKCGEKCEESTDYCPKCGTHISSGMLNEDQRKSKLIAGVLQIVIPGFAIGRFYLGYTSIGIAQIAVSFLTCGIGAIWPIIDGILILTGSVTSDADGNPLKD